ncbi:MAG: HEPN domain-containing protein [Deltaproteobacteria bacterium]|nr:HEPN domain-containing protein [Deltaproteobacteria bacterium]MBI2179398.1 HEPN domain-containing protein [Deltaproteobacteria bacterium]MBI2230966.1 HEPN domain-containing protein [Deltaproteobacteria bacterium]MBI3067202.1 HEPN domain-containing protein [Deltaproteobacteria bacterium]
MAKPTEEWLTQANYDMDTADYMFRGGRYMYTVFMCHLSLEKALKGRYAEKLGKEPPKTHNLLYLLEKMKLTLPEDLFDFISTLNRVSIPTRYPDDLQRILKDYDKKKTKEVLDQSKQVLQWLSAR